MTGTVSEWIIVMRLALIYFIGMDKIEKIKAEIERLKNELSYNKERLNLREIIAVNNCYNNLIFFIDSLEEPVSEELEDLWGDLNEAADKKFFELAKLNSQEDGYEIRKLTQNTFRHVAQYFAQWQKQQMMKDVIDIIPYNISNGKIHSWIDKRYGLPLEIKAPPKLLDDVEINKKVKLIIIKEE